MPEAELDDGQRSTGSLFSDADADEAALHRRLREKGPIKKTKPLRTSLRDVSPPPPAFVEVWQQDEQDPSAQIEERIVSSTNGVALLGGSEPKSPEVGVTLKKGTKVYVDKTVRNDQGAIQCHIFAYLNVHHGDHGDHHKFHKTSGWTSKQLLVGGQVKTLPRKLVATPRTDHHQEKLAHARHAASSNASSDDSSSSSDSSSDSSSSESGSENAVAPEEMKREMLHTHDAAHLEDIPLENADRDDEGAADHLDADAEDADEDNDMNKEDGTDAGKNHKDAKKEKKEKKKHKKKKKEDLSDEIDSPSEGQHRTDSRTVESPLSMLGEHDDSTTAAAAAAAASLGPPKRSGSQLSQRASTKRSSTGGVPKKKHTGKPEWNSITKMKASLDDRISQHSRSSNLDRRETRSLLQRFQNDANSQAPKWKKKKLQRNVIDILKGTYQPFSGSEPNLSEPSSGSKWTRLKDLMHSRGNLHWGSNALRSAKVRDDLESSDIFDLMIPLIAAMPSNEQRQGLSKFKLNEQEREQDKAEKWAFSALRAAFAAGRSPDRWLGPKTPLRAATFHGRKDLVDLLLEARANPNLCEAAPPSSPTKKALPLKKNMVSGGTQTDANTHHNSKYVHASNVRLQNSGSRRFSTIALMRKKDKKDPQDVAEAGSPPLHLAVWRGNIEIVQALLEARANPNLGDSQAQSPLFFVDQMNICDLLLEHRARVDLLNEKNQTALHFAARAGLQEIICKLVKCSPPTLVKQMDKYGAKAMFYGRQAGLDDKFLLRSGLSAP
jgi:hypothetical protein